MTKRDEDIVCDGCLPKSVAIQFKCYPYHRGVKVFRLQSEPVRCSVCGSSEAKYAVSIIASSLRKEEALKH